MAWEIKIWHEDYDDRTRLVFEAGPDIPDEVVSSIVGSYWLEEVQYTADEWEGVEDNDGGPEIGGSPMHG